MEVWCAFRVSMTSPSAIRLSMGYTEVRMWFRSPACAVARENICDNGSLHYIGLLRHRSGIDTK